MGKVRLLRWVIFLSALVSVAIAPMGAGAQEDAASAVQPESAVQPMGAYNCEMYNSDPWAVAHCQVFSGEVRLRADCKYSFDLYSAWVGAGYHELTAGPCPWGLRAPIMEARY